MGLIANIKLANKINKAIKEAKQLIDNNAGLAKDVKKAIKNLKADIEVILNLLPSFRKVYLDVLELFNNVK